MRHSGLFLRWLIVIVLCLSIVSTIAQKKPRYQEVADSIPIWRTQAAESERMGAYAVADRTLSHIHLITGDVEVLKDRARVRQASGDSIGCCGDLRECARSGEDWKRRYREQCLREDTIDFADSGLPIERFSGIKRVIRARQVGEQDVKFALIDASDTVRVGLVISKGDTLFTKADAPAEYPGGMKLMYEYMKQNQRYPDTAYDMGAQGKVYVQFTVGTNGHITDVSARSAPTSLFDTEALRLVESMPAWTPGRYRGEAVPFRYTLPVVFRLK